MSQEWKMARSVRSFSSYVHMYLHARVSDVKCDFTLNKVRNPIYRKVVVAVHAKYSNSCDSCRPRGRNIELGCPVNGALMRELRDVKFPLVYIIDSALLRALRENPSILCTQRNGERARSLSLVSSWNCEFRFCALHRLANVFVHLPREMHWLAKRFWKLH